MRSHTAAGLVLLLIAPALPSCGAELPADPPVTHTITMEAVAFQPAALTLAVGDSVRWVNKDPFPHTATAKGAFDSREIGVSQTWQYTAVSPGEFPYVCSYHPTMKGTLRVLSREDAAGGRR